MTGLPYWRLSSFYFCYFAIVGSLMPYWSLYLRDLGFSAREIGFLSAILLATKMVAPNLWGWVGDRTGERLRIIRWGAFFAVVCFLGIFLDQRFAWFAVVITSYSFFWNAVLPQYEVVTLSHLEGRYHFYSRIRLWGSVGFIVAVIGLGVLFDAVSIRWLPWAITGFLGLLWFSSLWTRPHPLAVQRGQGRDFLRILRQPSVGVFFLCCFLMQAGHGPYYTFFSVYLQDYGFSATVTGWLWALGVVAEVILFLFMHRLLPYFGLRRVLVASLGLAALRWLMIGYGVEHIGVLLVAQCLHAASFGSYHAVAIELVRRFFNRGAQGQGQAMYSAASFGAGGAVGASVSGLLWDASPVTTFVLASAASFLAMGLAWAFIREPLGEESRA